MEAQRNMVGFVEDGHICVHYIHTTVTDDFEDESGYRWPWQPIIITNVVHNVPQQFSGGLHRPDCWWEYVVHTSGMFLNLKYTYRKLKGK